MSQAEYNDTAESGTLPGRHEWVVEPDGPMSVPENPEWNRFSDTMRQFSADPGVSYGRQDGIGTPDAVDHNRGMEDPSATIGYDQQLFPVNSAGDPIAAEAYGILRDEYNQLLGTLMCVERTEVPGGNDGAGMRVYTVIRGGRVESAEATLDPSGENPVLMELELQPSKVRSYAIHQPSEAKSLIVASSSAEDDGLEVTIESEDTQTTETLTLASEFDGYGDASYGDGGYGNDYDSTDMEAGAETIEQFDDIDSVWLSEEPVGDVIVNTDDGTTLMQISGGLTYSDDDEPVDGDRGVPSLGNGSRADPIDESYEFFVGDRIERPVGSSIRPRINSGSWSVENDFDVDSVHETRAPAVSVGDRTAQVEADVAGPKVSHDSMMGALQKEQSTLEYESTGGIYRFPNTVIEDNAEREREGEGQAVASLSETFESSGDPAIELEAT